MCKELVELTRKAFTLSGKREDTFQGGLSIGGYGALRNELENHESFGSIIALSAADVAVDAETDENDPIITVTSLKTEMLQFFL